MRSLPLVGSNTAVVSHRPDGHAILDVRTQFDDRKAHNDLASVGRDYFDNREKVVLQDGASHLLAEGVWRGAVNGVDQHHTQLDLTAAGGPNLSQGALMRAFTNVEPFGDAAHVYDVGAVDERGINWHSGVTATRISADTKTPISLQDGDTIDFEEHDFGAPGNMWFDLDVYAPGITPFAATDPDRAVRELDLKAVSPFFQHGSLPLRFVGQTGIANDSARFRWELSSPEIFWPTHHPASGRYPVQIMSGNKVLRSYVLDWTSLPPEVPH